MSFYWHAAGVDIPIDVLIDTLIDILAPARFCSTADIARGCPDGINYFAEPPSDGNEAV